MPEVHVIGSGPAGLAAALYLARAGLRPIVFEQAENVGSRFVGETIMNAVKPDVRSARSFGGYVGFGIRPRWSRDDRLYFVGERAGFQDALWGFGLRYVLHSGMLAAKAIVHGESYDDLCREHLVPRLETAIANRIIFSQLGNHGYEWVFSRIPDLDVLDTLHTHHRPSKSKRLLYRLAQRRIHSYLREQTCAEEPCSCLWCSHGKEVDTAAMDRCVAAYGSDLGGERARAT